jgi:hypothetical protein
MIGAIAAIPTAALIKAFALNSLQVGSWFMRALRAKAYRFKSR